MLNCLRRSFEQQRLLGSTFLSTTPTPTDNTDTNHAGCIDKDPFHRRRPSNRQSPVAGRLPSRTSFCRGPSFRGAPPSRKSESDDPDEQSFLLKWCNRPTVVTTGLANNNINNNVVDNNNNNNNKNNNKTTSSTTKIKSTSSPPLR